MNETAMMRLKDSRIQYLGLWIRRIKKGTLMTEKTTILETKKTTNNSYKQLLHCVVNLDLLTPTYIRRIPSATTYSGLCFKLPQKHSLVLHSDKLILKLTSFNNIKNEIFIKICL